MTSSGDNSPWEEVEFPFPPHTVMSYALATAKQDLAASYAHFHAAFSCVVSLTSHTVKMGRCMLTGGEVGSEWATTSFQNPHPASSKNHIRSSLYPSPTPYHLNILM